MLTYDDFMNSDWRTGGRGRIFALLIKERGANCMRKQGTCHGLASILKRYTILTDWEFDSVSLRMSKQFQKNSNKIIDYFSDPQPINHFGALDKCFNTPPTKPSKSKSETVKEEAVRIIKSHSEEDAVAIAQRILGFCNV